MNLSDNFTLEEMVRSTTAEARGIDNTPSQDEIENLKELAVNVLQPIRDRYGKPIYINSGYRCPSLNRAVGGVSNSQHKIGHAADIHSEDNKELWDLIVGMVNNKEIEVDQLIDESNLSWIHISYNKAKNRKQILRL